MRRKKANGGAHASTCQDKKSCHPARNRELQRGQENSGRYPSSNQEEFEETAQGRESTKQATMHATRRSKQG
jgi:hypothetical protein